MGNDGKIDKSTLVHSVSYNTDENSFIVASTKEKHHLTFTAEYGPTS